MAQKVNPLEIVTVTDPENTKVPPPPSKKSLALKNSGRVLKIFLFLISLPILASSIWLLYMKNYECENILRLPSLQTGIGIGLLLGFIVSNIVVWFRAQFPIPGLLVMMVPLLLTLIVGLALVGAYSMESTSIPASPKWLKVKMDNSLNWNNIKSCIYDTGACDDILSSSSMLKSYDINLRKLSSIEDGCCKPPTICGMQYVNSTYWRKDKYGSNNNNHDGDCNLWQNSREVLCYNCNSCRQGFERTLQSKWEKLGIFLVAMSLLLIVSHLLLFLISMSERYAGC